MLKKRLWIIACLLMFCGVSSSWAALSAGLEWECRTTGNSANGGAFLSGATGTDFSQQDAAQVAYTDLVIGNPTTTNLTSAANPFGATAVGNIINITGGTGFTTGRYEVISVAANVATMDRAVGTAGSTGGTGNLGGGVDHPNTISAVVVAGNTIYIQNGTYVKVGANAYVLQLSVSGGNGTLIKWIGYITNHSTIPTGTNRPILDGTDNTAFCVDGQTTSGNGFSNIVFEDATTAGGNFANGGGEAFFDNCRFTSCVDGLNSDSSTVINCEADLNTDDGLAAHTSSSSIIAIGCYAHDNTSEGFNASTTGFMRTIFCISDSNTSHGIASAGLTLNSESSISYNSTGASADGFNWGANDNGVSILRNNCSVDNGQYGFNRNGTTDAAAFAFDYNNYNGNGTAGLNNITAGANDNTNNPVFTGEATGDFTLNTASDTGLLGVGFPQTATNGLTGDYNVNIGVDQDKAAGAGTGGASFFSMN